MRHFIYTQLVLLWQRSYRFDEEFGVDSPEQGGGLGASQSRRPETFLHSTLLHFAGLLLWHVFVKSPSHDLWSKSRRNPEEGRLLWWHFQDSHVWPVNKGTGGFKIGGRCHACSGEKLQRPSWTFVVNCMVGWGCSVISTCDQEVTQYAMWLNQINTSRSCFLLKSNGKQHWGNVLHWFIWFW